ncbi:glycosyltransferase [Pediococcus cellicola]
MKMKILVCTENYLMDGLKRATTVVANELATQIEVNYYSLADIEPYFELKAPLIVAKHPIDSGGKSFRGAKPLLKFKTQIEDLATTLKSGKYDVAIFTAGLLTSFTPEIKRLVPDVRVIAWMHNNADTYLNNYYVQMKQEFCQGLRSADLVVTLTEQDLKSFSAFNSRTLKVHNPLTLKTTGKANLENHILNFTGRIDIEQKGIDLLLALAKDLPDNWKLSIAGGGKPEAMKKFRALIKKYGVENKIIYQGHLNNQELKENYQNASIFVMTSRWEGLPLVVGEAMSQGLPIVAMYNTGVDEYLAHGKYGVLLQNHRLSDFQKALKPLLHSVKERQKYAELSLKRARDFELTKITNQWLHLLNKVQTS